MYNYLEEIKKDVIGYLMNEAEFDRDDLFYNRDDLEDKLNDNLFVCDSVTGNASGSYTFCRATAKKYVVDNMELLKEALENFCVDSSTVAEKFISENWEYFDVTIRCYMLGAAINEALDELENDFLMENEEA